MRRPRPDDGRRPLSTLLDWLPVAPAHLAIACGLTIIAAVVQATIGIGFSIIVVPLLSLLDPRLAPAPQLLLLIPLTVTMAWRERHAMHLRGVAWVLVGRLPGTVLGGLLVGLADRRVLDAAIAGCVLLAVATLALVRTVPRNPRTEVAAGVVSGISSVISSIGGPPVALLYRDAPGDVLRSNLGAIFIVGLTLSIIARTTAGALGRTDALIALCLLPSMLLGLWLSGKVIRRLGNAPMRQPILIVASLAALVLLGRAVLA